MKLMKKLTPVALATSMALGGLMAPGAASAEVSASINIANMYLWRGVNLTPDAPAFSGSLDYAHDSGFYAGVWGTNEDDGIETDLYLGFGGEAGDFNYDVSYWYYMYPEEGFSGEGPVIAQVADPTQPGPTNNDLSDTSLSEFVIGLGFKDLTATFYVSSETQGGSDYVYYTLDYTIGDYNILYGAWSYDKAGNDEYSHVTLTYAYNDNLTFGVSVAQEDITDGVETDPLFLVSYSIPVDMK